MLSPLVYKGTIICVDKILNKELKLWNEYHLNENMRHLFIESPYYTNAYSKELLLL